MKLLIGTYGQRMRLLHLSDDTLEVLSSKDIEAENSSSLALSPDGRSLFAAIESGEDHSGVCSFEIQQNAFIKRSEIRGMSPDPCHVLYLPGYYNQCGDPDNGALLTADYSGGSVSLFPVQAGRIQPASQVVRFEGHGPVPDRQQAAHIHHLVQYGHYLLAVDLGSDCIHVLRMFDSSVRPLCDNRLNRELRLEPLFDIPAPAGSGPRHLVIDPGESHFYVITELSNELLVYSLPDFTSPEDKAVLLQRLSVGEPAFPEQAGGDIQLSPDGRHLYASLRNGGDGLVIAEVQPDGTLQQVGYQTTGAHVRDFLFLPGNRMVACCKNSRRVQFYQRNPVNGRLSLLREIPFSTSEGEPVFPLVLSHQG